MHHTEKNENCIHLKSFHAVPISPFLGYNDSLGEISSAGSVCVRVEIDWEILTFSEFVRAELEKWAEVGVFCQAQLP